MIGLDILNYGLKDQLEPILKEKSEWNQKPPAILYYKKFKIASYQHIRGTILYQIRKTINKSPAIEQ